MPYSDLQFHNLNEYPLKSGSLTEVEYKPESTHFEVWAPKATEVRLCIYDAGLSGNLITEHKMSKAEQGCWQYDLAGDQKGLFYTFNVLDNGQWLGKTTGIFPTAVGVNGERAAIVNLAETNPEGWENDIRPPLKNFSDIIIYEAHQRDYSISPNSGVMNKGKFLQWTEENSRNEQDLSSGLSHLKELGITHLHLLPSFDFATIDETKLSEPQYNWGYDPQNMTVPEGSYATDPYDPKIRILEFKKMVQSLHKAGIRIILDVVYNHVYDMNKSGFEQTAPGYFFRYKASGCPANGSGCQSETASERPMMRKFMIESLVFWAKEYHVDGFRFDLMGIHDIETMNAIRKALNEIDPSLFLYGEGWYAEPPQLETEKLAIKANTHLLNQIASFSDEFRDGLRGGWWDSQKGAFVVGQGYEENVKFGIVGGIDHPQVHYDWINHGHQAWAKEPTQMIGYVSCHDDLCLVDRLKKTTSKDTTLEALIDLHKLAQTIVLTSQAVPFLFAGEEIFRDKKGVHNSYHSPDAVNLINWANKTRYLDLFNYYKELIHIRKEHPAFHMGSSDLVRKNLRFLDVPHGNIIAYELNGKAVGDTWKSIIVVYNSNMHDVLLKIPEGNYTIICKNGHINRNGLGLFNGEAVIVKASSVLILHK